MAQSFKNFLQNFEIIVTVLVVDSKAFRGFFYNFGQFQTRKFTKFCMSFGKIFKASKAHLGWVGADWIMTGTC